MKIVQLTQHHSENMGYSDVCLSKALSKYNEDVSWDNEIKYFANSLASNTSIERGSIKDALETMKLIEIIYKADPIWKEKYYKK